VIKMWNPFKKKRKVVFIHSVQVRLTKQMIKGLDGLIRKGKYPNRSEAIRDAIRRM